MATPLRLACFWIYVFTVVILIATTVRSQQIENLQNSHDVSSGVRSPSVDSKKTIDRPTKEAIKPPVLLCHKDPLIIPPLYHLSESPYACVPQSVYYYPENYDFAHEHSSTPDPAAPKSFSTHYKLVQHILNDSAKALKNVENLMWWHNPGTPAVKPHLLPTPLLLSELESRLRPHCPPPSDPQPPQKPSEPPTDNEQMNSSEESSESSEEIVPEIIVQDDVVYTNENIKKQDEVNKDMAAVESSKTSISQNTQLNEQTSSQSTTEENTSQQSNVFEDCPAAQPTTPAVDGENDNKHKEIYSKLLGSVLALCHNISQQLKTNSEDEFAEAPLVQKLQQLIITSNATSVLSSIIERSSTVKSEANVSESTVTNRNNALNSLHSRNTSSEKSTQTESTNNQCEETISQPHKSSENASLLDSELNKTHEVANNSKADDCVITLSNGKRIKESQLVDILESARNPSEIILTIPNLLSGPLDKYQHVIENFPNSFVIDNAFVHLPNDLLVPYDTYKEVLDVFAKKSKTTPSKPKDVLLNSGKHLDTHVVARIIASTACPHDRFIILKGGTIVPYEIYKSYIDGLSQKDKETIEILIPYCAIPLPYTVYEEVVNSYLKSNTSDPAVANPLVHLWDSNEEVTLNAFLAVLNNAKHQEDITVTLPNNDVVPLLVYKHILDKLSASFQQHSNVNLPNTEERMPYSIFQEIVAKYVSNNATSAVNGTKSGCPKAYILTPHCKGLVPVPLPTDVPTTIPETNGTSNITSYVCYPLHFSHHLRTFPFSPLPHNT